MNPQSTMPLFLTKLIQEPPHAGEGVHSWLFRVARQLHAHLPAVEMVALLEARVAGCGRHVPRNEILAAVQNSLQCAWEPSGSTPKPPPPRKWPDVNHEQRTAMIRDGGGLADMWEHSKPRFEDSDPHAEAVVDMLFPDNPLLCCGRSNREFDTKSRDEWRGELETLALIVPSPMTTPTGQTKDGRESAHCLDNTGPRCFLVCEFDTGTADEHAALLMHLGEYAPLVCAVHSGNKSLHGWFLVAGEPDDKVERFFRYAVSLGADRATWTPCQFVRMPDGLRDNGRRQTVFFVNINPLKISI